MDLAAILASMPLGINFDMFKDAENTAIKVTNLDRYYRIDGKSAAIYKGLALEAKAGEVTLIMGASGSGKSSLLRQIALLDTIPKGDVFYSGQSVADLSNAKKAKIRAEKLGFIFQSFALIPEFSVLENCALPLLMNGYGRASAEDKAKDFIKRFMNDIDPDKKPNELSGGEQQRVAIIRALIHEPNVVIADEPTGNLDEDNAEFIKSELKRIAKRLGSAVIIVSHDKSFIETADVYYQLDACPDGSSKSLLIRYK